MADKATVFISGKLHWAKVLPDQLAKNYDGNGLEWSFDVTPKDTSFLKEHKLTDRLKDKDDARGAFLHLRKPEYGKESDGTPRKNRPYTIVDSDGNPWTLGKIGNGSDADVKLQITNYGAGKPKGIYALAIRVTNHIPYEDDAFAEMDASEPQSNMSSNAGKEFEELEDDVPF